MTDLNRLILCFLIFFSNIVCAETYIRIVAPELSNFEDKFVFEQARKMALSVLVKNEKYKILLSETDQLFSKIKVENLKMELFKNSLEEYELKFYIEDIKTSKEIKHVWAKKIPKRFLLLQTRMSLYELFYGREYVLKNFEKIESEIESSLDKKKVDEKKNDSETKLNNIDIENKKKKIKTDLTLNNQSLYFSSNIESSLFIKKKNNKLIKIDETEIKRISQLEKIRKLKKLREDELIDLSQLKKDVQSSLFKARNHSPKELSATTKDEDEDNDNGSNDSESEEKDGSFENSLGFSNEKKDELIFDKPRRPRIPRYIFEIEAMSFKTKSTYQLIDLVNNFNYLGAKFNYRHPISGTKGDDFEFSLKTLYPLTKKEDFQIPQVYNAHMIYLSSPDFLPFDFYIGLHYENIFFINQPVLGEGLVLGENKILWVQMGIERILNMFGISIYLQGSFAKNVYSTSDYLANGELKLDATKYEGHIQFVFLQNFRAGIRYMRDVLTSPNESTFSVDQSALFVTGAYIFR